MSEKSHQDNTLRYHQKSRPLRGFSVLSMGRVIASYSQPIRFVRPDRENAQRVARSP